jgi:hypothetical protein
MLRRRYFSSEGVSIIKFCAGSCKDVGRTTAGEVLEKETDSSRHMSMGRTIGALVIIHRSAVSSSRPGATSTSSVSPGFSDSSSSSASSSSI